jgi:hypothetical protein
MPLITGLYEYELIENDDTPPNEFWFRDRTGYIIQVNVTTFYSPDIIKSLTV